LAWTVQIQLLDCWWSVSYWISHYQHCSSWSCFCYISVLCVTDTQWCTYVQFWWSVYLPTSQHISCSLSPVCCSSSSHWKRKWKNVC